MLKVLRVNEDKVILGDPKTKELKTVNFVDCFKGIKVGDFVEIYTSDEMEFVTKVEEQTIENGDEKYDHPIVPEVITTQEVIIQTEEVKQEINIHQHTNDDPSTESINETSSKPKVRLIPLLFVMVFAIALSFYTAPFLKEPQANQYLTSFELAQNYLNYEMSGDGFALMEYGDFDFYEVPSILHGAGRTIDLVMLGQFKVIDFDNESMILDYLLICEFITYDEIEFCQAVGKMDEE